MFVQVPLPFFNQVVFCVIFFKRLNNLLDLLFFVVMVDKKRDAQKYVWHHVQFWLFEYECIKKDSCFPDG